MSNWFLCSIKWDQLNEQGESKIVKDKYLVDALSFTEAEARMWKELESSISGECELTDMKRMNYFDVYFNNDGAEKYFDVKIKFIELDEKSGNEKYKGARILLQANDIKDVVPILKKALNTDYIVAGITETEIVDVFKYVEQKSSVI